MKYDFTDEFKQRIKEHYDIVDEAGKYFEVNKFQNVYRAVCSHNGGTEENPSLTFYPDTQSFWCFGCHAGGQETGGSDIIGFTKWAKGIEYEEAIIFLAEQAGIEIPVKEPTEEDRLHAEELKRLHKLNIEYYKNLTPGSEVYKYFMDRGITKAELKKWKLGETQYQNKSVPVYAISNEWGETVGFSMRTNDENGKYRNSSTSDVFKKNALLYGLNYAKSQMRKDNCTVIVEGYNDVIALQRYNVPAVGLMCTKISERQASLIKRYTKNIILFLDGDSAGIKSTIETIKSLYAKGFDVEAINLAGLDPDDLADLKKENTYQYILDNKQLGYTFLLNIILNKFTDEKVRSKQKALKEINEILASIPNDDERNIYKNIVDQIIKEEPSVQENK